MQVRADVQAGSSAIGRNGTADIGAIEVEEGTGGLAFINFITRARGAALNGGAIIGQADMDTLAIEWCRARGLKP